MIIFETPVIQRHDSTKPCGVKNVLLVGRLFHCRLNRSISIGDTQRPAKNLEWETDTYFI